MPTLLSPCLFSLYRWGVALPLACALATPSHAALTGDFAAANWVLVNANKDEALPHPSYTCSGASGSLGNEVACVDLTGPSTGAFDLYGSAESYAGGENAVGATTTNRSSTFSVVNGGVPVFLGFDWLFTAPDGNNTDVASYLIGDGSTVVETVLSSSSTTVASTISGLVLPANGSIAFRVMTDNQGDPGILSITNFNATPVPGPLPILGAAASFRLRRRLRQRLRLAAHAGHRLGAALS